MATNSAARQEAAIRFIQDRGHGPNSIRFQVEIEFGTIDFLGFVGVGSGEATACEPADTFSPRVRRSTEPELIRLARRGHPSPDETPFPDESAKRRK